MAKKLILVTGAHRSGSTWIGKVISQASNVRYVHEPFNLRNKKYETPFNYWFEYVSDESNEIVQDEVRSYLNSHFGFSMRSTLKAATKIGPPKNILRALADQRSRLTRRTLMKDPIALLSAPWIYNNFPSDVVISIRHPAAFVASLKIKDWQFDFRNFLDQENLMNNLLFDFKEELESYAQNPKDIVSQGILLWNILYSVVLDYKREFGDSWYFVKHEDLSLHPIKEFDKLFGFLKLDFSSTVQKAIHVSTKAQQGSSYKRDSASNVYSWKKRLTDKEIRRIKEKTAGVWPQFYTESDWD